jgi:C-3',4' desaturase CrtD
MELAAMTKLCTKTRRESYDVAIVGGGIAGMATAARLQSAGLSTIVLEAHGQIGGCAGFFRERGFSFDVGATTLVDFERGGVGGELLDAIGMPPFASEVHPAYVAWLPDRKVVLHRDARAWDDERRAVLGRDARSLEFWRCVDRIAEAFWSVARRGVRFPIRTPLDALRAAAALGIERLPIARYLNWTMGDCLREYGLRESRALVGLLSMLVEDTVHANVDEAPLVNAALGITLRHVGLMRARGGMRGFWRAFGSHYQSMGGELRVGCRVVSISGALGRFLVHTRRGCIRAGQVVSALPAELSASMAPPEVASAIARYVQRDAADQGGAFVVFLGVPEREVAGQVHTHHQLLHDYDRPLGDGNNMFISVSAPGDTESAPLGHRAVMISTHCRLQDWEGLGEQEYSERKSDMTDRVVNLARRVYPELGSNAVVLQAGTPRTYERFTHRPRGAVGGARLTLRNSNQRAIPHDIGVPGFWLAGDTTWPGLGTVACVLGSRIVAGHAVREARRVSRTKRSIRDLAAHDGVLIDGECAHAV